MAGCPTRSARRYGGDHALRVATLPSRRTTRTARAGRSGRAIRADRLGARVTRMVFRQLLDVLSNHVGRVPNPISESSRRAHARIRGADVTTSVCPYCAVGCSQLVYAKGGHLLHVEGNPASPINAGTLCPKGAATYQLAVNPLRLTRVKYRAPGADRWEEKPLDWAMERIAQLVKKTRDENWVDTTTAKDKEGKDVTRKVNHTPAIASLGGATLDNEWNYVQLKLMRALGVIWLENQARI